MSKAPPARARGRDGAAYTCTDRVRVCCRRETLEVAKEIDWELDWGDTITAPRNGILLRPGKPPTTVVSGTRTSRDMSLVACGGPGKTYAFPSTITDVAEYAFCRN